MAFGSFTITVELDQLGEAPAPGFLIVEGIPSTILDPDDNVVFVGPKRIPIDGEGKVTINLPTNVSTGQSATIGYRVSTDLKGGLTNILPTEFWARAIGSVVPLSSILQQVVEQVGDTTANRIAAQAAAQAAAASAASAVAVGTTNDTVIASRINDAASASHTAVVNLVSASASGVTLAQVNNLIATALSQVPALGEQPIQFTVLFPGEVDPRSYTSTGTSREVPLIGFLSPVTLLRVAFWFNGPVASSSTNYYTFSLERNRPNEAIIVEQTTTQKAIATDTAWTIDVPFDAAARVLIEGDSLQAQITVTGAPAPLVGPIIGTAYAMRA